MKPRCVSVCLDNEFPRYEIGQAKTRSVYFASLDAVEVKTKFREAMNPQRTTKGTDIILAKGGIVNLERKATIAVDTPKEMRLTAQNRANWRGKVKLYNDDLNVRLLFITKDNTIPTV